MQPPTAVSRNGEVWDLSVKERFLIKSFIIFVKAWCWFNATNLSRETLAETLEKQNAKKRKFENKKILFISFKHSVIFL